MKTKKTLTTRSHPGALGLPRGNDEGETDSRHTKPRAHVARKVINPARVRRLEPSSSLRLRTNFGAFVSRRRFGDSPARGKKRVRI